MTIQKLNPKQKVKAINRVMEYLETEIQRVEEFPISHDFATYHFWQGHKNGTRNALSKIRWELGLE